MEVLELQRLSGVQLVCDDMRGVFDSIVDTFAEIFVQQVDDSGPQVVIKNVRGGELYNYGVTDLAHFVGERGSGQNRLRTARLAQPHALKQGDILATGDRLLSAPREGGNGEVLLHFAGGGNDGCWIAVPSRIPIALLSEEERAMPGLVEE
jgi:hypothetical protein